MTPKSFLLDPVTGDIDMSQGLRFTPDLQTYVVQRLDENFSFFLGEYFLDERLGIPYHERVIGQKPDFALLQTLLSRAALQTVGVAAVPSFRVAFERKTRRASPSFSIVLTDGSEITEASLRRNFIVDY
jgi:hypothetical protein